MSEPVRDGYARPEIYDLFYAWRTADIPWYVARAKEAAGPVLEIGCGTGRVLVPTLEAGADIDGLDVREGMLARLRSRLAERGLKTRLQLGDMRDFTMPRRYALVTIPFRALLHNLTQADQIATLRLAREHLESGGRLVFDTFLPDPALLAVADESERIAREFLHPETGRRMVARERRRVDLVEQILNAEITIEEHDAGGTAARHPHRFSLRYVYKPETELLLRAAGFHEWEMELGFADEPSGMVWTAWKD